MLVLERRLTEHVDIAPDPARPGICWRCTLSHIGISEVVVGMQLISVKSRDKIGLSKRHRIPIRGQIDWYYRNAKGENTKISVKFLRNNDKFLGRSVYLGFRAPKSVSITRHDAKERTAK